jgi:hypothetical protein
MTLSRERHRLSEQLKKDESHYRTLTRWIEALEKKRMETDDD